MAITINTFFTIIALSLLSVFIFLRPMDIKQELPKEIAQLELIDFEIYELNASSLNSVLKGSSGKRYKDRYEVYNVSFVDNSKKYKKEMSAGYGLYKDKKVTLDKNVHFKREDGLEFISNEAQYDQKKSIATTKGKFKILYNDEWVYGNKLYYNAQTRKIRANKVEGLYNLEKDTI